MRLFKSTLQQQVDIFIEQIRSGEGPIDITPRCGWVGLDTIAILAFSYEFNTQRDPENRFIIDGLFTGSYKNNIFLNFPLLHHLGLDTLLASVSGRSRERLWSLLKKVITGPMGMGKNVRHDLVYFVTEGPQGAAMDDTALR